LSHATGQGCGANLLQKPQRGDFLLPIHDKLALNLNEAHSGIFPRAVVDTVLQIAEPRTDCRTVQLLDPRIVVAGRGGGARDGDPVLGFTVLNRDLDFLVLLDVLELLGMLVGEGLLQGGTC